MIPKRRTDPAQLPLPFHPSPIMQMTQEEKATALTALAQLLFSAAGTALEETSDEH